MRNIDESYDHDALWQAYLWPSDSGEMMLRNRYGLHDEDELGRREHGETAKRKLEIRTGKGRHPPTPVISLSGVRSMPTCSATSTTGQAGLRTVYWRRHRRRGPDRQRHRGHGIPTRHSRTASHRPRP
ncbi:hypothetical protein ACW9HR_38290 [Nocardia gipuzkoensis]